MTAHARRWTRRALSREHTLAAHLYHRLPITRSMALYLSRLVFEWLGAQIIEGKGFGSFKSPAWSVIPWPRPSAHIAIMKLWLSQRMRQLMLETGPWTRHQKYRIVLTQEQYVAMFGSFPVAKPTPWVTPPTAPRPPTEKTHVP